MDETIRVRIVADTKAANSSLKALNKDTKNLGTGTEQVNYAVDALNKALNSLGFQSVKIKSTLGLFGDLKKQFQSSTSSIKSFGNTVKQSFKSMKTGLKETKDLLSSFKEDFKVDKNFNISNYDWYTEGVGSKAQNAIKDFDVALG